MLSLLLILFFGPPSSAIPPAIDLDREFLAATGRNSLPASPRTALSRGWDASPNLPPVVKQSPFGACQSFSMTAMMEYLFYRETGKTLKLSEKQMAYRLLQLMIEENWNPESRSYPDGRRPDLGKGIAPWMIETVSRFGLLPNSDYPWGDFESADGSRSIDAVLFRSIFDEPERAYSHDEYLRYLDEAFLSAPPERIRYTYRGFSFASGKEEELVLRSASELGRAIGLEKNRFLVSHNAEMNPVFNPRTPGERAKILAWLEEEARRFGVRTETAQGDALLEVILRSLQERMVVLLATDVWIGSWAERLVYAAGGGHGVVIVGYQLRDGEVYLKLRNSWGKGIGVDGYNYVKWTQLLPNIYYVISYK